MQMQERKNFTTSVKRVAVRSHAARRTNTHTLVDIQKSKVVKVSRHQSLPPPRDASVIARHRSYRDSSGIIHIAIGSSIVSPTKASTSFNAEDHLHLSQPSIFFINKSFVESSRVIQVPRRSRSQLKYTNQPTITDVDHPDAENYQGENRIKNKSPSHNQDITTDDLIQLDVRNTIALEDARSDRTKLSDERHQISSHRKKKRKCCYCCLCSPLCSLLSVFGVLLLGIAIAAVLVVILASPHPTTTTSTNILTSTTATTSTTTTVTTSTTTTQYVCGFSCVNQTSISSSNILAKWTFDGKFNDLFNNYNATPSNNPSFVTGYVNQALSFNAASNQFLSAAYLPITNTSFTIDAWLFITGFPNAIDHGILGVCPVTLIDQCLHLTIRKIVPGYYFYFGFYGGDDCRGVTSLSLSTWMHVAFVLDAITLTQSIYLNGVLGSNRTALSFILPTPGANLTTIGNIPNLFPIVGNNFFQGYIDQLTVSNRVKTSCEILDDATLAARFTFDGGSPLADSGPNSVSAIASAYSIVSSGHFLQAISFNGSSSSYFQASGFTALGIINQPFSISLWVRPRYLTGPLVHVSSLAIGYGWCLPFLGFAANGSLIAQIYNSNGVISVVGPSIPTALSVWSHIVQTWSPTNGLRLYMNNILVASQLALATTYVASSASNYITLANSLSGIGPCAIGLLGTQAPFNGDIDDLRVYSRELTANDVCALYVG